MPIYLLGFSKFLTIIGLIHMIIDQTTEKERITVIKLAIEVRDCIVIMHSRLEYNQYRTQLVLFSLVELQFPMLYHIAILILAA